MHLLIFPDATRAFANSVDEISLNGFAPESVAAWMVFGEPDAARIMDYLCCPSGNAYLPGDPPPPPPKSLGSMKSFFENLAIDVEISASDFSLAHRIGYCLDVATRKEVWTRYKDTLSVGTQAKFLISAQLAGINLT